MTSPALFVLSLALVCSICGIASEQRADHGIITKMRHHDLMGKWTKSSHIHNEQTPTAYTYSDIQIANLKMHQKNLRAYSGDFSHDRDLEVHRRVRRDVEDPRCESFEKSEDNYIMHPHQKNSLNKHYFNDTNCVLVVNATDNQIIQLTFVDMFRIEYHPQCAYDYLEIRDGLHGYADLLGKFCGEAFPRQLVTSGPNVWLKFKSDDTIEYEGFKIQVVFKEGLPRRIPQACYIPLGGEAGIINKTSIPKACTDFSEQSLDVLWTIQTAPNTRIYLNFTSYDLVKPNECEENVIQVFGAVLELDPKNLLTQYCGSVANSVTTREGVDGNIMHVRFFGSKLAREAALFRATYNAYRTLDQSKETDCKDDEFNCDDNTCIAKVLMCDGDAHCRLKADEDKTTHCGEETQSTLSQTHIIVILVIFSLILSGMSFVFLFKCIRKLYQDHKIIKAHIRQSCEDRLDSIVGSRLTLDPKRLQRDSEPRASLERENKTNELKKQRSFSKHKQSSIESDYIEETHLDLDDEPWRREVDSIPVEAEDIRIERNGRTRRSDFSKKEESMRSRTKETERDERKEKKEIRDVSVGAPDTKESSCQTRESLFQADAPPSSDGSGTNSRGFSTFGYSGATIARPSPPAATNTSEITIELLSHDRQQETKNQKKMDRRPISTETTRSAPDVIIVSKPIR